VPLSDGRFACGRVLDVPREPDLHVPVGRMLFLAGLLDWVGETPPTNQAIAGAEGGRRLRPVTAGDHDLPVMSTWGYSVISVLAEQRFVGDA
jgi:hypothetical protein